MKRTLWIISRKTKRKKKPKKQSRTFQQTITINEFMWWNQKKNVSEKCCLTFTIRCLFSVLLADVFRQLCFQIIWFDRRAQTKQTNRKKTHQEYFLKICRENEQDNCEPFFRNLLWLTATSKIRSFHNLTAYILAIELEKMVEACHGFFYLIEFPLYWPLTVLSVDN